MEKKIDWEALFKKWHPSKGAKQVTDEKEISALVNLVKFYYENEKRLHYFATSDTSVTITKKYLSDDGLGDYELIQLLYEQLSVHRRLWDTHLEKKDFKTVETAFKAPTSESLRYLKFQFMAKNQSWMNPNTVERIFVNYHPSTIEVKVMYVQKT